MAAEPETDAVVVAAGSSRRMGGIDKLDADILGRSVLRWSVEAMAAAPGVDRVVVVAAPDRVAELKGLPWLGELRAHVVGGGRRRQDSVRAGVAACDAPVVLVHDAARPLVSAGVISRVRAAAVRHGAAVPVLPVVDALKWVEADHISGSADRSGLFRAQTPQGARTDLLRAALDRHARGTSTYPDEAELLAEDGVRVAVVDGDASNVKITVAEDLALARRLAGEAAGQRLAQGSDSHPFGPGQGLKLGGLTMDAAPQLFGHSDGDVVLHALCDGLLAAAGLGDLGRIHPSGEKGTRGIDSRRLLEDVVKRLDATGLAPASADVTILGARPRLGAQRLDAMAESIAALLGVPAGRVSVKSATGNLSGDEGAGRAISASCLVSVVRR